MQEMNIYGVAQPTQGGIATVLTVLNCHPTTASTANNCAIWVSAREEVRAFDLFCQHDPNPIMVLLFAFFVFIQII